MQLHDLRLFILFAGGVLLGCMSSSSAHAGITYFENPAEGQNGHFAWQLQGMNENDPVTFENWLDITKPSTDQFALGNGDSIAQLYNENGGDDHSFTEGGAETVRVPRMVTTQAFEFGDDFSGGNFDHSAWHWLRAGGPLQSAFTEGELLYMGVRTQSGNFGWIAVIRDGFDLKAQGWAYETRPGVPLSAGQIPAPGAIGVFALAGLMRVRRRRR